MRVLLMQVAEDNGVNYDQFINHYLYLNGFLGAPPATETYSDTIHLNAKGHGHLAQAIYMRMAFSPAFMKRHAAIQVKRLGGG